MRILVPIVLSSLVLAGCLEAANVDPAGVANDAPVEALLPFMDLSEEHDHADFASHDAGWNVGTLGYSPLSDDPTKLGRYNQVQVFGDYAFVSAYAIPPEMKPGLLVVDISDRENPVVVGKHLTVSPNAKGAWEGTPIDVHLSEDGQFAALAGHRWKTDPSAPRVAGCTGVPAPGAPQTVCQPFVPDGVTLLDVSDPANPKWAGWYVSAPSGAHTVKLKTIDGELYAFIASYGFSYANRYASSVDIVRYDESAPYGFEHVARFFPSEMSGVRADGRWFVHDIWVEEHPVTEETLLYLAYWDGGVVIANVDDPANPVEIAQWNDFDTDIYGNIHFVQPMPVTIDGKHYTVAAPEYGAAEHAGETYVIDTTDPTKPALVAKWHLPGNPVNPGGYMHSPHNFDLRADGKLVMGHYHAGVWILDLAPVFAGADEPEVLGYRFPVPPADAGVTIRDGETAPNVWNAVWLDEETLVASDIASGLHVLAWDAPAEDAAAPYAGKI